MRATGRKPKPTRLKELAGNPGGRKLNDREPDFPADSRLMAAPEWFDPLARAEWERIAPAIMAAGIFTNADRAALEGYCKAYSRWRQAEEIIERSASMMVKTPNGHLQQMPHVSIAQRYLKIMVAIATEFGFTPAARSRIAVGKAPDAEDDAFFDRPAAKPDVESQELHRA